MAYEFLEALYGTPAEGEAPKSMTFAELSAAIDAADNLQIVNLAAGGYVPQADYNARGIELDGVRQQLSDANDTIASYGSLDDIEKLRTSVTDWKTKYETDTNELNNRLTAQAQAHAEDMATVGLKFSSAAARKAFLSDLHEAGLKLQDGKLLGFDDFVKAYKETDADAFAPDAPADESDKPYFSGSTNHGQLQKKKKMSLMERMKWANEHPGEKIKFD